MQVTEISHLPIRYFLALLWARLIVHISTIRVNSFRTNLILYKIWYACSDVCSALLQSKLCLQASHVSVFHHTPEHRCVDFFLRSRERMRRKNLWKELNIRVLTNFIYIFIIQFFFGGGRCDPTRAMASSFMRFLDHTQRLTTFGRTPLDGWSVRRRDLYLTTNNTHNRQIPMLPPWLEPAISAGEMPQTHVLDPTATGTGYSMTGNNILLMDIIYIWCEEAAFT